MRVFGSAVDGDYPETQHAGVGFGTADLIAGLVPLSRSAGAGGSAAAARQSGRGAIEDVAVALSEVAGAVEVDRLGGAVARLRLRGNLGWADPAQVENRSRLLRVAYVAARVYGVGFGRDHLITVRRAMVLAAAVPTGQRPGGWMGLDVLVRHLRDQPGSELPVTSADVRVLLGLVVDLKRTTAKRRAIILAELRAAWPADSATRADPVLAEGPAQAPASASAGPGAPLIGGPVVTSEEEVLLARRLAELGLETVEVPYDGDCFYASVLVLAGEYLYQHVVRPRDAVAAGELRAWLDQPGGPVSSGRAAPPTAAVVALRGWLADRLAADFAAANAGGLPRYSLPYVPNVPEVQQQRMWLAQVRNRPNWNNDIGDAVAEVLAAESDLPLLVVQAGVELRFGSARRREWLPIIRSGMHYRPGRWLPLDEAAPPATTTLPATTTAPPESGPSGCCRRTKLEQLLVPLTDDTDTVRSAWIPPEYARMDPHSEHDARQRRLPEGYFGVHLFNIYPTGDNLIRAPRAGVIDPLVLGEVLVNRFGAVRGYFLIVGAEPVPDTFLDRLSDATGRPVLEWNHHADLAWGPSDRTVCRSPRRRRPAPPHTVPAAQHELRVRVDDLDATIEQLLDEISVRELERYRGTSWLVTERVELNRRHDDVRQSQGAEVPAQVRAQYVLDGRARLLAATRLLHADIDTDPQRRLGSALALLRDARPLRDRWAERLAVVSATAVSAPRVAAVNRLRAVMDAVAVETGRVLPASLLAVALGDEADAPFVVGLARSLARAVTELNGFSGLAPVLSLSLELRTLVALLNIQGQTPVPEASPAPVVGAESWHRTELRRPDLGEAVWYGPRSRPRSGVDVDLREYVLGYPANPRRFNVFVTAGLDGLPQPVVDRIRTELDSMADARRVRFTLFGRGEGVAGSGRRVGGGVSRCRGAVGGGPGQGAAAGSVGAVSGPVEESLSVGLVPGLPAGDGMWYVRWRNGEGY